MQLNLYMTGDKEIMRKLATLPIKIQRKAVPQSLTQAARPVLNTAKSNAIGIVGGRFGSLLRKNIVSRVPKRKQQNIAKRVVRIKSMREGAPREFWHTTKDGKEYYVPAAVEYGHTIPAGTRRVAAMPFMRSAWLTQRHKAYMIFWQEMKRRVEITVGMS